MKRISLIILATLALVLLVSAYGQTTTSQTNRNTQVQQADRGTPTQQMKRDTLITPEMQREYVQLIKSRSGKAAVQAWARKHKLEVVSLKGYDILVPERPPTRDQPEEVGACDATKCPIAVGTVELKDRLGKYLGLQFLKCTAGGCTWVKDSNGRYLRLCGKWKCENDGPRIGPS